MVDYMKESLRLLNENIDLNAELVRCRLKLKQAEAEVDRLKPIEELADKNFKLWENAAYSMNAKLRAENAKLRKVAEVAIEYLSDRHIVTTRDMEEALNNYEAWKETQK